MSLPGGLSQEATGKELAHLVTKASLLPAGVGNADISELRQGWEGCVTSVEHPDPRSGEHIL